MKKGIAALIAAVIVFVCFYGIRYVTNPVDTQVVYKSELEDKASGDSYIIRKETLYKAQNTGTIYTYVSEGERVKNNKLMASVYNGTVDEAVIQELNSINDKIQQQQGKTEDVYLAEISSSEEKSAAIKKNIISSAKANNIKAIAAYKKQLNAIDSGETTDAESGIKELEAKKTALENSIMLSKTDIVSQGAGIFSRNIDGLETITEEEIVGYGINDFNMLSQKLQKKEIVNNVNSGEDVCKVVDNHIWYVVAKLPAEQISGKTGDEVRLRFDEIPGDEGKGNIIYISSETENSDDRIVVIKCQKYQDGAFSIRKSKVTVIFESYAGFEIPMGAIRVSGDKEGVLVSKGGKEVFKPCEVVYSDKENGKLIVKAVGSGNDELQQYDVVVVGEK